MRIIHMRGRCNLQYQMILINQIQIMEIDCNNSSKVFVIQISCSIAFLSFALGCSVKENRFRIECHVFLRLPWCCDSSCIDRLFRGVRIVNWARRSVQSCKQNISNSQKSEGFFEVSDYRSRIQIDKTFSKRILMLFRSINDSTKTSWPKQHRNII
jgi:hypothetical protein